MEESLRIGEMKDSEIANKFSHMTWEHLTSLELEKLSSTAIIIVIESQDNQHLPTERATIKVCATVLHECQNLDITTYYAKDVLNDAHFYGADQVERLSFQVGWQNIKFPDVEVSSDDPTREYRVLDSNVTVMRLGTVLPVFPTREEVTQWLRNTFETEIGGIPLKYICAAIRKNLKEVDREKVAHMIETLQMTLNGQTFINGMANLITQSASASNTITRTAKHLG